MSCGRLASGTIITSAGLEIVSAGGTATNTSLVDDGQQNVFGTAVSTTLGGDSTKGLVQLVGSGGNAIGTTVAGEGRLLILSGGTATGATLNSGGFEGLGSFFTTGGTAISTTINSGGSQEIDTGGSAIGTTVNSGGPARRSGISRRAPAPHSTPSSIPAASRTSPPAG